MFSTFLNQFAGLIIGLTLCLVVTLYFVSNPLKHGRKFMIRRFINWFPLGMTYAFLYMARYNLSVSKNALGESMSIQDFGIIFAAGTITYGFSFLLNGPLVDKIGGKKGIVIAALGSSIANAMMGLVTYLFLHGRLSGNLTVIFSILYSINMFFQSYGAVSIIKVKAYWFHVRERGVFGAIFGTLISFGVYFAFDWGQMIVTASKRQTPEESSFAIDLIRRLFAVDIGVTDATWLVFFIPAFILVFWGLLDMLILKDTPAQANFDEFETADASSDDATDNKNISIVELLKKIFSNPILLTIAFIEFTSGVLRNGITQWYFVFAKEVPQMGAEFFKDHWGFLLAMAGIFGGFSAGLISDKLYHSRRGPPAALMCFIMFFATVSIAYFLYSSPLIVGISCVIIAAAVIGVHSLMSGTAAADFGGKKMTATASGVVDGFVYLGSGLQSIVIGYLAPQNWLWWPFFLIPFTLLGLIFSIKMWHSLPEATRRYLLTVEKIDVTIKNTRGFSFRSKRSVIKTIELKD
jgi:MFS transporter, OPA family, glycerol-3-phosphate transporter